MITKEPSIVGSYLEWIKGQFAESALSETTTELTTPFLDRHNDHLQMYAERRQDMFLLTDDGYIISELKSSGVEVRGSRRAEMLSDLLSGHGVRLVGRELQIEAGPTKLGQAAHSLIQAMLAVDDMFLVAQPKVESYFYEDVTAYLDEHDVRYSPRVKMAGKSGLDHMVDFVIPRSKRAPERILQVVNSPRRDRIESLLFAASDTKAGRGKGIDYYALLNDQRMQVPSEIIHAFSSYEVHAATWEKRGNLIEQLAA